MSADVFDFEARRRARIDSEYAELRAADPDLFRDCVRSADAVCLNNREIGDLDAAARLRIGADIEARLIATALRARKSVQP